MKTYKFNHSLTLKALVLITSIVGFNIASAESPTSAGESDTCTAGCACYCAPGAPCNCCCDEATKKQYTDSLNTLCKLSSHKNLDTSARAKKYQQAIEVICQDVNH